MDHSEFSIGLEFTMAGRTYRCTDVGTRTIAAIRVDAVDTETLHSDGSRTKQTLTRAEAEAKGWFNGPTYAVQELSFDEDDFPICEAKP